MHNDNQFAEEMLIQNEVKMTIQILCDEGLFDSYDTPDEVILVFLLVERRRPDLEDSK